MVRGFTVKVARRNVERDGVFGGTFRSVPAHAVAPLVTSDAVRCFRGSRRETFTPVKVKTLRSLHRIVGREFCVNVVAVFDERSCRRLRRRGRGIWCRRRRGDYVAASCTRCAARDRFLPGTLLVQPRNVAVVRWTIVGRTGTTESILRSTSREEGTIPLVVQMNRILALEVVRIGVGRRGRRTAAC